MSNKRGPLYEWLLDQLADSQWHPVDDLVNEVLKKDFYFWSRPSKDATRQKCARATLRAIVHRRHHRFDVQHGGEARNGFEHLAWRLNPTYLPHKQMVYCATCGAGPFRKADEAIGISVTARYQNHQIGVVPSKFFCRSCGKNEIIGRGGKWKG